MRVAFLGLPLAALALQVDGHDVAVAFISRRDGVGLRRLRRRLGEPNVWLKGERTEEDFAACLRVLAPDLLVSWFWTGKIPLEWVRTARLGAIGAHPSLLPRHRGPDPYFAAINAGDPETGVTVHRIDAEYDTGPMLLQQALRIDPSWNAWQLARKLDRPSLALLREAVGRFARGEPVAERAQDARFATWAETPGVEDCALVWSESTDRIARKIRALAPAPGAFTEIGDLLVTVQEARPAEHFPRALAPGEAATVGGAVVVRTSDGALELVRVELEDGEILDGAALAARVERMA